MPKKKYLEFKRLSNGYYGGFFCQVRSKLHGDILGYITYYKSWKRYIFQPVPNTIWSHDCLQAVADYLKNLKGL